MNSTPRPPTLTNTRGHPPEFQQLIQKKSQNFAGRQFVFAAVSDFLHRHNRGYFTIVGTPGSGKSAILAKYVTENPHIAYYNAEVETLSIPSLQSQNQTDHFLTNICTQLIDQYSLDYTSLPDNATEGSWFLSRLLQTISDQLKADQPLIIAIDSLDAISCNSQPPGSNLFYLPRYLPDQVYFLLTRRPFLREKSGLLIETPAQTLNLDQYPEQNREDVQAYIQLWQSGEQEQNSPLLTEEKQGEKLNLKSWLTTHNLTEPEFSHQLTAESENNFMYLSEILTAIAEGFYSKPFPFDPLPPKLQAYYQNHWQRMASQGLSSAESAVLNILVQQAQPLSTQLIAQMIDEDEYEVEAALENWIEFLQLRRIREEICYSLYHSSFRNWLAKQQNVG